MKQLKLQTQGWGGIRDGAGHKSKKNAGISHRSRTPTAILPPESHVIRLF